MGDVIRITEVGPRDGLQNQPEMVGTDAKVAFVDLLSATGVAEIEVSSFVSPRRVPQLSDADDVFVRIERRAGVVYSALVPNEQGLERALRAKADKVAHFTAASETFSRRNTNMTIDESVQRLRAIADAAHASGLTVRSYISCVVACPFEGPVAPARVRDTAARLLEAGADEIDLGDTIGVASPVDIERLYDGLSDLLAPGETTLHLHDTRGTALACAVRALQLGVTSFDGSCGGLGGCPFAPGAAGNMATEDFVYLCNRMDLETGVDLEALFAAARSIEAALGTTLPGRVYDADGREVMGSPSRPVPE